MADADKGAEKLDKILSHLDSASEKLDAFGKRLDAMEAGVADSKSRSDAACEKLDAWDKERKDAAAKKDADEKEEKEKKDAAAKKDAEEKEEKEKKDAAVKKDAEEKAEQEKKDAAARADAASNTEVAQLRKDLAALSKLVPAQVTQEVRAKMVSHTVKAEPIYQAFGDSAIGINAPSFVAGESERDYAIRLLTPHLKHSKRWKDVNLEGINDSMLAVIEADVYADAMQEATRPTQFKEGVMIPQRVTDAANRVSTRYVGDPNSCWNQFCPPTKFAREGLASFRVPGGQRIQ